MMQRKSESPLEFYYRLNKVADKAGIDFDSSSKQRERHLKVFTKKLLDSRLRTTLQGQPYVIQDEDSPDEDEDDREVHFQDLVEDVPNVPPAVSPAAGSAQPGSDSGGRAQDISKNEEYLPDLPRPDQPRLEEDCPDNNDWDDPPEFRLGPGQRYGWWEEHNSDETKLLVRSPAGSAQVHMSREAKLIEETGGSHEDSGSSEEILKDWDSVIILDEDSDSDDETFYDAISFDGDDGDVYPQEVVKTESQTGTCSDRLLLPVRRLEKEYERCMQMSAEELSLEPACDIKADVGEPRRTTPSEEKKLRARLRYHHRIFLVDGNATAAPAQGVWYGLDVGDAKPVAQRPRSIAPHLAIKVYELLKKLLETGLIEHSGSPWASPIVIVLKKNGVDIRMCIDYRVVNGFTQLSNYPLPLIDDLLIGFESAM
ncbi:unnamed protein product [Phytophthora fragariaefolia]|uniref:Unnamed protein product n=1 Tax=Phytophthora fragariaefolia TaxID=1490495 RepID=A0A9W6Y772_9STRA|nr:unnamed protein product [Phytophthora fragariaefolia]